MSVKPIPSDSPRVTPFLIVNGAAELIDFVKEVFDADEGFRMEVPGGPIMHAELRIGDSVIMLCDANEKYPALQSLLYVYVENVDETYKRALRVGGKSEGEPTDQFYGDRSCSVRDKWGNKWGIASKIEEVSHAEITRRAEAMMKV